MIGTAGSHVGLQLDHAGQSRLHRRIGEGVTLHFLATHAPVGIKIEHYRFALGCRDRGIEFGHAANPLKSDGRRRG